MDNPDKTPFGTEKLNTPPPTHHRNYYFFNSDNYPLPTLNVPEQRPNTANSEPSEPKNPKEAKSMAFIDTPRYSINPLYKPSSPRPK